MGVSKNNVTPKSSILMYVNRVFHYKPFWGTPIFGNTHIYIYMILLMVQKSGDHNLGCDTETLQVMGWNYLSTGAIFLPLTECNVLREGFPQSNPSRSGEGIFRLSILLDREGSGFLGWGRPWFVVGPEEYMFIYTCMIVVDLQKPCELMFRGWRYETYETMFHPKESNIADEFHSLSCWGTWLLLLTRNWHISYIQPP